MIKWPNFATFSIDLYSADINDYEIALLQNYMTSEEWINLKNITHRPTFSQKALSRSLLRYLLQYRYGIEGENIVFEHNERGKPLLKNHPNLNFNNSHSHHKVLVGITEKDLIGVDIEWIQPMLDEEEVAKRMFSSIEFIQYQKYRQENKKSFFLFWTAKEAIIKALGKGLWEVDQVPSIGVEDGTFFLYSGDKVLTDWTLYFPNIDEKYVACVVVNCPKWTKNIYHINLKSFSCTK